MSLERPNPFIHKWGEKSLKEQENKELKTVTLPPDHNATHSIGKADIETGFPEITMRSVLNGGVPPWGQDHNGILYLITRAIQYQQAGGSIVFNDALSQQINGYSQGAIIQSDKYPWVFWISLIDHNMFNPNLNDIKDPNPQENWIRFPPVSSASGNLLQYTSDGKLLAPSPAFITTVYVDSDAGDDLKNNGSISSPYRSIYRAILSTSDYTSVSVRLKAYVNNPYYYAYNFTDKHGHVKLDTNGNPVWAYPGSSEDGQSIWIDKNEYNEINNIQSLSVGSRKVTISTYGDKFYDVAAQLYAAKGSPTDVSAFKGITRPKIIGFWRERLGRVNYLSFSGNDGDSQISFTRVEIALHDVDKLTNAFPALVGLFWSGVKYSFGGVVFHTLPQGGNHYLADGGGDGHSYYSIGVCRFESFDSNGSFVGKFLLGGGATQITVFQDLDQQTKDGGTAGLTYIDDSGVEHPYEYIDMNQQAFLSRKEAYERIDVINNPSKNYKGLITNFTINGV